MTVKDKTLAMLEKNRGEFFSGEKLAEELGVSRNAVWKAIKQLEMEGYPINAIKSKGYSLEENSDRLSLQGIMPFLNSTINVDQIEVYESIDSTNNRAKEVAMLGAKNGTVIISNEQTKGRGRYGKTFESPKDSGIYMSFVFRPENIPMSDPSLMTAYAAVIVSDVLEGITGKQIGIKWVNDLFLNGKKVCGILTEAVTNLETGMLDWIVVGIGINVLSDESAFSSSVNSVATTLFNEFESNSLAIRNKIAANIINAFSDKEKATTQADIMQKYREKSIVLGRQVSVVSGDETYIAIADDILDNGSLVIKLSNGEKKEIRFGEVSIKVN